MPNEIKDVESIPVTESEHKESAPIAAATEVAAESSPPVTTEGATVSDAEAPAAADAPEADSSADGPRRKNDPQKRIDKVTSLWRSEQREKEYWKGRAEALAGTPSKGETPADAAPPAETPAAGEPVVEDFDDLNDWARAHNVWEAERRSAHAAKESPPTSEAPPPTSATHPSPEQSATWDRLVQAQPDFIQVINEAGKALPRSAIDAAHEYPNAPEILYQLAKAGDLERFADLNDRGVKREIQRFVESLIEAPVESETPTATATPEHQEQPRARIPERKTTRAGPVPTVISGSAPADTPIEKLAETDIAGFIARRNAHDKKAGYL